MHPHMLRHTFVTTMLDAGVSLRDVQIAARHADPARRCDTTGPARTAHLTPAGQAVIRRAGQDATLIGYGPVVPLLLEAAEVAAAHGIDLEVIDLRSLAPFDDETICGGVTRTGRAVVVHESHGFGGPGAEIAARVTERCFHSLRAPVQRVAGAVVTVPVLRVRLGRRDWATMAMVCLGLALLAVSAALRATGNCSASPGWPCRPACWCWGRPGSRPGGCSIRRARRCWRRWPGSASGWLRWPPACCPGSRRAG